jgi:hypothetical protein
VAADAHAPERRVYRQHADVAARQLLVILKLHDDVLGLKHKEMLRVVASFFR